MRIGLDIGGTKTDSIALDSAGRELARVRRDTGFGPEAVLAGAEIAVQEAVARAGASLGDLDAVGVGIPGVVDESSGQVTHAVNLGVTELDLSARLSARVGVPVRVENDVNAAALGACHLLGLARSAALLNLGTGMAAGVVVGGRLWRGARGGAGEIGHVPIDPEGAVCSCGQRGCLETVASGSAIARLWPTDAALPSVELFDRADAGDPRARDARRTFVRGVATAVRMLALTVDVETVIIGGGLSRLGERLSRPVACVLDQWAQTSAFLASLELPGRLMMLPADVPVAAVGAALLGSEPETIARPSSPPACQSP